MTSLIAIGINDYSMTAEFTPGFDDLDYGISDAIRFADEASRKLKIRRKCILHSEGARDDRATRVNMIRRIVDLDEGSLDNSIIYFAGHAIDVSGSLHLCPQDYDPRVATHSAIALSLLVELAASRSTWCLIIVDACRNQGERRRLKSRREKLRVGGGVYVTDNVCIFFACTGGEQAYETPTIDGKRAGGVFTHYLCERVSEIPPSQKRISMRDLFEAAQERTSAFVASTFHSSQTPRSVGMSPDDAYFTCLRKR